MSDIVARRMFDAGDQQRFANLSGDRNPMHLDPVAARRTPAGQPVVHGVHTLLWALGELLSAHPGLAPPAAIRADFLSFLPLDKTASLRRPDTDRRVTVIAGDVPILRLELRDKRSTTAIVPPHADFPTDPIIPAIRDLAGIDGDSGGVTFATSVDEAARAFPAPAIWLGARRVAAMLACTRLVGMVCPGLHSIFNRLDISLTDADDGRDALDFAVAAVDSRFRRVALAVAGGGIGGTLTTSVRQPPVAQPALDAIAGKVPPGLFAGAKVLVVGGSRGLGEVTAKLLAAGGAELVITYALGRDDAERVANEIRGGGGSCRAIRYDAGGDPRVQLPAGDIDGLTHLYYFATPPILAASAGTYDKVRFDRFADVYMHGFAALCAALAAAGEISIYYPSSVMIDDRPDGFGEYAMAKAAGEILCAQIARRHRNLRILATRLPRLATDQTASLVAGEETPVVDILLPIVRQVQGITGAD